MPLTNTSVIPERWSQAHQPVAESGMPSTVDILIPLGETSAPNPFDPQPEESTSDVLVAAVPARIKALGGDNELAPSGQTYNSQAYLVQVPAETLPVLRVGKDSTSHRLRVTSNPNGTGLEGRIMQILAAPLESEAFNRDLYCQVHTDQ